MWASSNFPCLSKTFPLCNRACLNKNRFSKQKKAHKNMYFFVYSFTVFWLQFQSIASTKRWACVSRPLTFTFILTILLSHAPLEVLFKGMLKPEVTMCHRWFVQKHVLHKMRENSSNEILHNGHLGVRGKSP